MSVAESASFFTHAPGSQNIQQHTFMFMNNSFDCTKVKSDFARRNQQKKPREKIEQSKFSSFLSAHLSAAVIKQIIHFLSSFIIRMFVVEKPH